MFHVVLLNKLMIINKTNLKHVNSTKIPEENFIRQLTVQSRDKEQLKSTNYGQRTTKQYKNYALLHRLPI